MKMFQINVQGGGSHLFKSVNEGYQWVCQNVMNEGDVEWYRECGNEVPLWEVQGEQLQEVVLRNSFENVVLVTWNENAEGWMGKSFAQFH